MTDWPPKGDMAIGPGGREYYGRVPDDAPSAEEVRAEQRAKQQQAAPPPAPIAQPSAEPQRGPGRPRREAKQKQVPGEGQIVIFPGAPYDVALEYGKRQHMIEQLRTLHHHRGEFFGSNGVSYEAVDIETVKSKLYPWLANCWQYDEHGEELKKVLPKPQLVNAVIDALGAACQIDNKSDAPFWLKSSVYKASELIVARNTMFHWPSGDHVAITPAFFTANSVDFDYSPNLGAEPVEWLKFLRDLWPDDQASIDTLQEIFGLMLTTDCSFQKLFLLIGPKRSGKGTIARVLQRLVGVRNSAAPTLASLGGNFGLQPLIHKTVAIVGDARIGPKTDVASVAERLLSISGEDLQTVERKYLGTWTGTLGVRFLIISNEIPRFTDASGALASRFVILSLRNSFIGREDLGLLDRLLPELPQILNWSIEGLKRLKARRYFVPPESSKQHVAELDAIASPMIAFLGEHFEQSDGGGGILIEEFWQRWQAWCKANGRDHPGTKQAVGLMLRAAWPHVETVRLRTGDRSDSGSHQLQRWFVGIKARTNDAVS